jgi:hypothetical protein
MKSCHRVATHFTLNCASIDAFFDAARLASVTHEAPIDPNIIICRSVRREALLETAAHLVAIQRRHLLQRGASLIDIFRRSCR